MKRMPVAASADQLPPDMARMLEARLLTDTKLKPAFSWLAAARQNSASVLRGGAGRRDQLAC